MMARYSPEQYFEKACKYYKNAKERLKGSPIEYGVYKNPKAVQEASAIAYLAMLNSAKGFLTLKKEKIPKSIDGYLSLLKKHTERDGKLITDFSMAYDILHINIYYRDLMSEKAVKDGFSRVKFVIERLSGRRL